MNNSINPEEINSCNTQLKNIITNLDEKFNLISTDLNKFKNSIEVLKSWNGASASELYTETPETEHYTFNSETEKFQQIIYFYYKDIWKIIINNLFDLNDKFIENELKEILNNINNLSEITLNIELMNESFEKFIHQIETQLSVSFTGDILNFFGSLKENENWLEIKKVSIDSKSKKEQDEIYQKYRSKIGKGDYVDFALDELGNKLLVGTSSTKYALWYLENYPNSGASKSDDWCAEFVSYVFFNSGNKDKITPHLACVDGVEYAKQRSANGDGVWHDISDTNYQPQRGDIFYNSTHTGIVIASDENYIYTIEGNTPEDNGLYYIKDGIENRCGGYVNTRIRSRDYVQYGYYTPNVTLNTSGVEQSINTDFSDKYINTKLEIQNKFNELKIAGGHDTKYTMG